VLMTHPAIAMVAVIGVPHPVHGEEIKAFVLPRAAGDRSRGLIAWCRERMAAYKYPRLVEVVESLPMTPPARSSSARCAVERGAAQWRARATLSRERALSTRLVGAGDRQRDASAMRIPSTPGREDAAGIACAFAGRVQAARVQTLAVVTAADRAAARRCASPRRSAAHRPSRSP
jgi:hypothetical protein